MFDIQFSKNQIRIRDYYEQILFLDSPFARSKDIDQLLWKCVYYRPIEDSRKRIQKVCFSHTFNIVQQYQQEALKESEERGINKEKLNKITLSFLQFLDEATKNYENLFEKLQRQLSDENRSQEQTIALKAILQKTLIILGDLGN